MARISKGSWEAAHGTRDEMALIGKSRALVRLLAHFEQRRILILVPFTTYDAREFVFPLVYSNGDSAVRPGIPLWVRTVRRLSAIDWVDALHEMVHRAPPRLAHPRSSDPTTNLMRNKPQPGLRYLRVYK